MTQDLIIWRGDLILTGRISLSLCQLSFQLGDPSFDVSHPDIGIDTNGRWGNLLDIIIIAVRTCTKSKRGGHTIFCATMGASPSLSESESGLALRWANRSSISGMLRFKPATVGAGEVLVALGVISWVGFKLNIHIPFFWGIYGHPNVNQTPKSRRANAAQPN
jgi:hypothetical protein